METGKLTIIGCGIGRESLSQKAIDVAVSADLLAGGIRLLELFPNFKGEKVILGADAAVMAEHLLELARNKVVAVLASGDPLLHGIGGTFARLKPSCPVEVIPNVSAMQAVCAKLLAPWDSLSLFSVHGSGALQWREILASPLAAVYCDHKITAAKAAASLIEHCPSSARRQAAVAADLGLASEFVLRGTLEELARLECGALSTLLLLPCEFPLDDGLSLGLPDSLFVCEGRMMTHPELRAVALAKLRLGPGVMWDVGAGSGSVGIEAALLARGLKVFAVEKDAGRIKLIRGNALNLGANSLEIVEGAAPAALSILPKPRAVFLGGGGAQLEAIFDAAWEALLPGGTLVAVAALLETRAALTAIHPENCAEVVSISVSRSAPLGKSRLMKAENPSELFVYKKPIEEPA